MEFLFGADIVDVRAVLWLAPMWKVLLGTACILCGWGLLLWKRSEKPMLEHILWGFVALLLIVLNAEPNLVSQTNTEIEGKTVILIDSSASMSVVSGNSFAEQSQSRLQRAQNIANTLQSQIGGNVEKWYFHGDIEREFSGFSQQTDIAQGLRSISDRYLGSELRGVIVITDGIDRASLHTLVQNNQVDSVPKIPGPLTIVQIATEEDLYDESVVSVQTGEFAFQRTEMGITAIVQGKHNSALRAQLLQNNKVVDEKTVQLDAEGKGKVEFSVRPLDVGRFAWSVSIPVSPLDVVPSNNYFPVVIKVVRNEVRVLQVSGSPSYDQKFLRLFLKEDPSVDLISFFILRTHADFDSNWDSDELSLIAFPYEKLFTEELETFDLVIFQNFDYKPYFTYQSEELLQNIVNYVENGGAFVMTGGDRSFDLGDYSNTPIEKILPVELGTVDRSSETQFLPRLSKAGQSHPITKLSVSPEENTRIWSNLPKMDGCNLVMKLQSTSAVLLEHPTLKDASNKPLPILSVREVGKGRVMALGIDSSWRWSYSQAVEGGGNQAYLRLWKNAIRWLIADPEDASIIIVPSKENALQSEEMTITVRTRDTGYQPQANVDVQIVIHPPEGEIKPEATTLDVVTDSNGEATIPYTPTEQGIYTVDAVDKKNKVTVQTVFAVTSRMEELQDILPNTSLMQSFVTLVAEKSSYGSLWVSSDDDIQPLLLAGSVSQVPQRKVFPIARAPIFYIFLVGLLTGAVWVRRRNGRS